MKYLIVAFIVVSFCLSGCGNGDGCTYLYDKYTKPNNFHGTLENKYYDSTYKFTPRLIIKVNKGTLLLSTAGQDTTGGLWNNVSIGDTIIKKKGDYHYVVEKNGVKRVYYFGTCGGHLEDTLYWIGKIIR
jgi:hypothetical protein